MYPEKSFEEEEIRARAEHRKKLASFSLAQRELVGKAIIDGLLNPEDLVASSGGGGNYVQDGGPYTQGGGGNHWQGGTGGYTQNKTRPELAFDPSELAAKFADLIRVIERSKGSF